ncbi:hypothetical protein EU545_03185, partial [Candidatus Thorarchaeota archaeon]
MKNETDRMLLSLEGLSVGDAFGEQSFYHRNLMNTGSLPPGPWPYTDDTAMAMSIVSVLLDEGQIDQDSLAASFANHYNPVRGYGPGMRECIPRVRHGEPWRPIFASLFDNEGSFGNGASMRVAPLGAFFADRPDDLVENAALSAQVTHHHPEATAGAIAVAMAAAVASGTTSRRHHFRRFIERVIERVPDSMTRNGISLALELGPHTSVEEAARRLGSGYQVTTQDTVPFVIWCSSRFMGDYEEALRNTIRGGGDLDTTCAMVGGIVVMSTGVEGIPGEWL